MSALCKYVMTLGKRVGGSDRTESEYTRELASLGAEISIGSEESIKEYDLIVCTDAVGPQNGQLIEAKKLGKRIIYRGQFLKEVALRFKKCVAVSGCHGKTTCTSMLAHILFCANKKFTAHIGGKDMKFSNFYYGGDDIFITEACEYKKNFLYLTPDISVILNTEPDHLECYGSYDNLLAAYRRFAFSGKECVTLSGDGLGGITFGLGDKADYTAKNLVCRGGAYSFDAYKRETFLGAVDLNVFGKHNVLNALAAVAVADRLNIEFSRIREGLGEFKGAERRFEYLGRINGAGCIADYAHHPTELSGSIDTANGVLNGGNLFVIFQPHTYSRTKILFREFIKALAPVHKLLIYRTFAAREYFDDEGSALTLSQAVSGARYGDCPEDILDYTRSATENDLILFLGAGDIYDIAKNIVKSIKE